MCIRSVRRKKLEKQKENEWQQIHMKHLNAVFTEGCWGVPGTRQEEGMDGGDVTITEMSRLICSLTRNRTGAQAQGRKSQR